MFDSLVIEAFDITGLHLIADLNGLIFVSTRNQSHSALYSIAVSSKVLYSDHGHYFLSYKEHKWLTSHEITSLISQIYTGTYDLHLPVWQSNVEKRQ